MGRGANRLNPNRVKALKEPGHYVDGDGLALVIGKRGGKSWVLRTVVKGKRTDIGLGGVSWVSLAEAREKARELRKIARNGGDPRAVRRAEQDCPTFEESAKRVHAEQIAGQGKNEKHRDQWLNTLRAYAFPLDPAHDRRAPLGPRGDAGHGARACCHARRRGGRRLLHGGGAADADRGGAEAAQGRPGPPRAGVQVAEQGSLFEESDEA